MALVEIVTTGGTIASRVDPATGAAVPAVRAEELLASVPGLDAVADVRVREFDLVNSWNLTPTRMADLAAAVHEATGDADGVVVTHGTDTLEETAFALELLRRSAAPVVVTGAMRNPSLPGADGPRNLWSAVRVAVDGPARDAGVLVVLNDEVHAARHVRKTHATALDTFRSPDAGPVATVDDAGVAWRWRAAPLPDLAPAAPDPDVALVTAAAGLDDRLLRAAATWASGVVVEGTGSGNLPAAWQEPVAALVAAGVPVVLTSRTGSGRVVPTYGNPGGGRTLVELGAIPAGDLPASKARIALAFALGAGRDVEGVRRWFAGVAGTAAA